MVTKDELIPPRVSLPGYARRGDFKQKGEEFLQACIQRGGLKSSDRVLDLGCGVGRLAVALTAYLNDKGTYVGVDVSAKSIRLARVWIGSKDRRFRFRCVAAYNGVYNPDGKLEASDYRFPFKDESFDFVFSNSLFTHLLPNATINYFHEISRVLRPGGRTLNSMFLLNQEVRALIDAGQCPTPLPNDMGVYRTKHADRPEAFVVYDENFLMKLHRDAGLLLLGSIRYGKWCGRSAQDHGFGEKDLITAIKPEMTCKTDGGRGYGSHPFGPSGLLARLRLLGRRAWRAVTRIGKD
jgi:SAM-dependent methyltransferase